MQTELADEFNWGIAAVVFVFISIPALIVLFDAALEKRRFPPIGQYVQDWSERHPVLGAVLLMGFAAVLVHFTLHRVG